MPIGGPVYPTAWFRDQPFPNISNEEIPDDE
jgi:hypothetical protein